MGRVVHFEIEADDLARAKQFYETVFEWKIEQWKDREDYWLIMTGSEGSKLKGKEGDGIDGALLKRRGNVPTYDNVISAYVCSIEVDNIDESLQSIVEHAGNVIVDKLEVPGVGWTAYCKDTEGNTFGLLQVST